MVRDYKNITETKVSEKKSRMKSKSSVKASAHHSMPAWLWLLSGLIIGGFISFLVYLKISVPMESTEKSDTTDSLIVKSPAKPDKKVVTPKGSKASENKEQPQSFEFYNILPNREVIIPESRNEDEIAKEPITKQKKIETTKLIPTNKNIVYVYTLQVGSFLRFKDADRHKANLALLGFGSRIHAIKTNKITHYRVLIGPYDSIKKVNEIDSVMKSNKIKTLLLREKG